VATPHQSGSVAALTLSPRLSALPLEALLFEPKGSGCPSWGVGHRGSNGSVHAGFQFEPEFL